MIHSSLGIVHPYQHVADRFAITNPPVPRFTSLTCQSTEAGGNCLVPPATSAGLVPAFPNPE
jgi:hypothetical protein